MQENQKVHFLELKPRPHVGANPSPRHRRAGSLAGVVHLSNDNAGVLRRAKKKQKSHVEQEGKSSLDYEFK